MTSLHAQVQFTIDDPDLAGMIVTALLDRHLIACGQRVGPIVSRYWWQGAQEEATEWLVLAKTRTDLVEAVIAAVTELHPYQTPEVVALPIEAGHAGYLQWIDTETRRPETRRPENTAGG